jgi:hypothetical protein
MKLWGRNLKEWIWLSPKVTSSNGSQLYSFYFSFDRKAEKVLSLWTLTELKKFEDPALNGTKAHPEGG